MFVSLMNLFISDRKTKKESVSVRSVQDGDRRVVAHRLPAHGVEVGQAHEGVVVEIAICLTRCGDFGAQFCLDIGVERKLVQDPAESTCSGVVASEYESTVANDGCQRLNMGQDANKS